MAKVFKTGGRQKGATNKATAEVRDLALDYGPAAVTELARLSKDAQTETARIQACNAILDRAYGRPQAGRPIILDLPDASTIDGVTKAVAAVIRAASAGEITPAEAGDFCGLLDVQRRAIELTDIEKRLSRLEAAQGRGDRNAHI